MQSSRQQRVIDHFRRSMESYDDAAMVQKMASDDLISKMGLYSDICYNRVLEVGCCTGSMTETLCSMHSVGRLWVNDLVSECCQRAAVRVNSMVDDVCYLAGDIEVLSIPDRLDLIVSSSTFQWLKDLPNVFQKFAAALNDNGFLAFTLFGPGTMQQIRELIDVGLKYVSEDDLEEMLQRQFHIREMESSRNILYFDSPREVLRHIQITGVGGAGNYRWTPRRLRTFEKNYTKRFGTSRGMPIDYVSTCVIAQKIQGAGP